MISQEELLKQRRLMGIDLVKNMSNLLDTSMHSFDMWGPPIKLAFEPAFKLLFIIGVRLCRLVQPFWTHLRRRMGYFHSNLFVKRTSVFSPNNPKSRNPNCNCFTIVFSKNMCIVFFEDTNNSTQYFLLFLKTDR